MVIRKFLCGRLSIRYSGSADLARVSTANRGRAIAGVGWKFCQSMFAV